MIKNEIINWLHKQSTIVENLSFVTILQLFYVVSPLITFPYLTHVLGMELYGMIITAQVLVSYANLIINFGSDKVCAKHIAIYHGNKEKQSEVLCSVFYVRLILWAVCFCLYIGVVLLVPSYRFFVLLFLIFYSTTLNDLFFPQYFFQGIEKMKFSTLISVGARLVFIILIFFIVKSPTDYIYVPVLYGLGSVFSGLISFVLIFSKMKYHFYTPSLKTCLWYVKDASPLFVVDLILTIKDKFNVLLLGVFCGMATVVVYDIGTKINSLMNKPAEIISTVMLPSFSRSRNIAKFNMGLHVMVTIVICGIILVNIFMPQIVNFFIHKEIELIPLRIFSISPLFLSINTYMASNLFVAFGYNKYQLYSILVATAAYLAALAIVYFTGNLSNIFGFILLTLTAYFVEFVYRIYLSRKVLLNEELRISKKNL